MKIGIINSGLCNLGSVLRWVKTKFEKFDVIDSKKNLIDYDLIIFPGVGSFDSVITFLEKTELLDEIKKYIDSGGRFFGICLGFQILFNSSEEGKKRGLGYVDTTIEKLDSKKNVFVPHVGFNEVNTQEINLFQEITNNSYYFTHSFGFINDYKISDLEIGTTSYDGIKIKSFIKKNNILACQFHPEKSSKAGIKFLNILEKWLKKD